MFPQTGNVTRKYVLRSLIAGVWVEALIGLDLEHQVKLLIDRGKGNNGGAEPIKSENDVT